MVSGGIWDKLGNRYEAKWLVRHLLDVISGKAKWLIFEGIPPEFVGFEFAVNRSGITEWHQSKINGPNKGNWTIKALQSKRVLTAFKTRLAASPYDTCHFVSQDPAKDMRSLSENSRLATDLAQFTSTLSNELELKFRELIEAWGTDQVSAYDWLKRCYINTLPVSELESLISSHSDILFWLSDSSIFSHLRDYADRRFNQQLTTERVRAEIRNRHAGNLVFKDWSLDPTLREKLRSETESYLRTYSPFGAGGLTIDRPQVTELANLVTRQDGPQVILLTGAAGTGKSGILQASINQLRELEILHLAFRIDHHLNRSTPLEIGDALTNRQESPVITLKGLEPEHTSVFIIDQIDAVSEVSGRNGAVKEAVLKMISEARIHHSVRVIIACRTFDFDNDLRFKMLEVENSAEKIEVPDLVWDHEVEPLISVRCCLLRPILQIYNEDPILCGQLVERLVTGPISANSEVSSKNSYSPLLPLLTSDGVHLVVYLLHGAPAAGRRLLNLLLNDQDEKICLVGAWLIFRQSFHDSSYFSDSLPDKF